MTDTAQAPIASRYHYMINLLETLRAFGGDSESQDVYSWFRDQGIARASDVACVQKSKETRFVKEVRFARQTLSYGGLVETRADGRWSLTPEGWETYMDPAAARALARRSNRKVPADKKTSRSTGPSGAGEPREGPTTGPVPHAWSGTVSRSVSGPASTYAMRFGGSSIWKIGHSGNITHRLADLNRHLPREVLPDRWKLAHERRWPNAEAAYAMEQRVLQELRDRRTTGERVDCPEELLLIAWEKGS